MIPTPDASKLAYGIAEAANALSVGKTFIYAEINAGRLSAFKAGTRTLIPAVDLLAWIEAHKAGSANDD